MGNDGVRKPIFGQFYRFITQYYKNFFANSMIIKHVKTGSQRLVLNFANTILEITLQLTTE